MKKLLLGTILMVGLMAFPVLTPAQVNVRVSVPLPPPIPFMAPPNVVILPGTDVYAVPDVKEELFFRQGWWWRPWGGHWYRSKYHDRGWAYYRGNPSWFTKVPHDWRNRYSNHIWGGRPWDHSYIGHGDLNRHWRGRPGGGPGGRNLHGGGPGGRSHPDGRMNRSDRGGSHRGDRW
jgi:hypothetical protein